MNWFRSFVRGANRLNAVRHRPKPKPSQARPAVEHLEDRCCPSTITELPSLPAANAAPTGITTASDGSIWFTEQGANKLGRQIPHGALTEYAIPTAASAPEAITASPNGYVWFSEQNSGKIGRISQSGGLIAEFKLPGSGEFATALTTDAKGTVWFASSEQPNVARVGSISATGVIHEVVAVQSATYISGIVAGPDGNFWVTEVSSKWGDSVAKVTTAGWGSFFNYRLPNPSSSPQGITVGPDSSLWFTEAGTDKIGRITTTGLLTQYALPTGSRPEQITAGPDGAVWFTEQGTNKIGRLSVQGVFNELAIPTGSSQAFGITKGQDGNLWFTEESGNKLGEVIV
jgi:streptogramin lyase